MQNLILKVSKVEGDLMSESQNDHRKILNLCTMKPSRRSHTSSAVIFFSFLKSSSANFSQSPLRHFVTMFNTFMQFLCNL